MDLDGALPPEWRRHQRKPHKSTPAWRRAKKEIHRNQSKQLGKDWCRQFERLLRHKQEHGTWAVGEDAPAGPVGAKFKLIANVVRPEKSMWHGGNGRTGGNSGDDYFMGLNDWSALQTSHRSNSGRPAHLFVKIFMDKEDYLM